MKNQTIKIKGAAVELRWGDGSGLGVAVHTAKANSVGKTGPSDGEIFEVDGKQYELGPHRYSTDQPGCDGDDECVCVAEIRAVEQ